MTIRQKNFITANSSTMTISELGKAIGLSSRAVSDAIKGAGLERKRTPATFDEVTPQRKQMRVFDVMKLMCEKPRKIRELALEIKQTERTAYRYMALMIDLGIDVKMTKDGRYFFDDCPFCKKRLA